MQCKPVTTLPAGENWTFEIKFDGYRCIAVKRGKKATVFSRNRKVLNKRFPKVVEALASLASDFVLDGELAAFIRKGCLGRMSSVRKGSQFSRYGAKTYRESPFEWRGALLGKNACLGRVRALNSPFHPRLVHVRGCRMPDSWRYVKKCSSLGQI
jgi:ATP dependent DNA ligase-like protein